MNLPVKTVKFCGKNAPKLPVNRAETENSRVSEKIYFHLVGVVVRYTNTLSRGWRGERGEKKVKMSCQRCWHGQADRNGTRGPRRVPSGTGTTAAKGRGAEYPTRTGCSLEPSKQVPLESWSNNKYWSIKYSLHKFSSTVFIKWLGFNASTTCTYCNECKWYECDIHFLPWK